MSRFEIGQIDLVSLAARDALRRATRSAPPPHRRDESPREPEDRRNRQLPRSGQADRVRRGEWPDGLSGCRRCCPRESANRRDELPPTAQPGCECALHWKGWGRRRHRHPELPAPLHGESARSPRSGRSGHRRRSGRPEFGRSPSPIGCELCRLHAQSDAFGKQLVWVALRVADESVTTPFLARHRIVPPRLRDPSPTGCRCQPVRSAPICHRPRISAAGLNVGNPRPPDMSPTRQF
jgi:hypothetical protein